jgi:transcriptional regulator GlxA family with amidase domain
MQIINNNLGNPKLSIPMIADQMGIGVRNLYRFLDKMNVEKPSEIIRNMRLKRASYLLTHTNLTVEEVAFKCGFNNRSTFHHIFVKSFGCSPRQYHDKSQQNAKKIMNEGNPREYLSSGPDGMTNM